MLSVGLSTSDDKKTLLQLACGPVAEHESEAVLHGVAGPQSHSLSHLPPTAHLAVLSMGLVNYVYSGEGFVPADQVLAPTLFARRPQGLAVHPDVALHHVFARNLDLHAWL